MGAVALLLPIDPHGPIWRVPFWAWSHARGDAHTGSDLDFLVIEPEVDNRRAESVRLRRELRGLGVAADVVVLSADHVAEWGEVKSTMLHQALTEGRVLAAA